MAGYEAFITILAETPICQCENRERIPQCDTYKYTTALIFDTFCGEYGGANVDYNAVFKIIRQIKNEITGSISLQYTDGQTFNNIDDARNHYESKLIDNLELPDTIQINAESCNIELDYVRWFLAGGPDIFHDSCTYELYSDHAIMPVLKDAINQLQLHHPIRFN